MRRLAHGGSVRPGASRPGNGYGRLPRRCPGPLMALEPSEVPEPAWFLDPPPIVVLTEADVATQLQPRPQS
jgi:hypothetical protein